jgi:catechol 2,3-dioxygenase-like lactoylglutathione lyase family enzyme
MSHKRRFDHVGVTVADLDRVTAFFVGPGLEVEGRTFVEGEFVDTVIGIPGSRSHIVMLRPPDNKIVRHSERATGWVGFVFVPAGPSDFHRWSSFSQC